MSGNQWGPPPGQYPQQPPPGQYPQQPPHFPPPQGHFPPGQPPYQGVPQPYYAPPPPGQPQFGWGPQQPRPPRKKGSAGKAALIVLGVIGVAVAGMVGLSAALKDAGSSYSSDPTPSYTYSPTTSPTTTQPTAGPPTPVASPTTTKPVPVATRPTAPRTTKPKPKKPQVSDLDRVARNRVYKSAGTMRSVGCRESSARPATAAGAKVNYRNLINCLNRSWPAMVQRSGVTFRPPRLMTFTGTVQSPCGAWSDTGPPFYCPSNGTIYMNITEDTRNYALPNDYDKVWARMWMLHQLAHEYGHHVQNLTGIMGATHQLQYEAPTRAKELEWSRRLELQASCFGDIFIGSNRSSYPITGQSKFQWNFLIGAWTDHNNDHGDGVNHKYWALRGWNSRNPSVCNTFTASSRRVQ
ncbi:neutral zinc metallopeptidase [Kribbella sandramycini]|nr:putative metalloprotease [Kribbella sandramycini]